MAANAPEGVVRLSPDGYCVVPPLPGLLSTDPPPLNNGHPAMICLCGRHVPYRFTPEAQGAPQLMRQHQQELSVFVREQLELPQRLGFDGEADLVADTCSVAMALSCIQSGPQSPEPHSSSFFRCVSIVLKNVILIRSLFSKSSQPRHDLYAICKLAAESLRAIHDHACKSLVLLR